MGLIGGYDGRLYCDHPDCVYGKDHQKRGHPDFEGTSLEDSYEEFIRAARKAGWSFSKKTNSATSEGRGYALCPKHSGKIKKETKNGN